MNYINKHNRLVIFLIIVIVLVLSFLVFNKNNGTVIEDETSSYIKEFNTEKIKFKERIIVLNKIDLDIRQKSLLDIDNNGSIDINDLYIAKDIINKSIKENKKADLNYDKKIDRLDSNLLKRYKSGVIDLDINNDLKEDLEDINLLDLYINSFKELQVLVPKHTNKDLVKLEVEDNSIISLDNGVIKSKKEGITKVKVIDNEGNTDYSLVIVIDYNEKDNEIYNYKDTIYLSPTHLTTVEKSNADINKDNSIDTLDYEILKRIINNTFGDLNKDGITNNKDVKVLKDYLSKENEFNYNYDLNYDGYINNKDLDLLNRFLSPILIGDINKDTMVEDRDIKIINKANYSYDRMYSKINGFALNKKIEYLSSDSNIVSVSNEGVINALREGEVTITMKSNSGNIKTCKVISKENNKLPTSIKADKKEVVLNTFNSRENDILSLDLNNDGVVDSKDLDIYKKIKLIKINQKALDKVLNNIINKKYNKEYDINSDNKLNLKDYGILYNYIKENGEKIKEELFNDYLNNSVKLNIKVSPNNSINRITYMSKNSNIAKVNNEGVVTAINKGETEIVAFTVNGIKAVTKVIVK